MCAAHLRRTCLKSNIHTSILCEKKINLLMVVLMGVCCQKGREKLPPHVARKRITTRSKVNELSTLHKVSCVGPEKDMAKVLCQIERQAAGPQSSTRFQCQKAAKASNIHTYPSTHPHTQSSNTFNETPTHTHVVAHAFCINYAVAWVCGQGTKCIVCTLKERGEAEPYQLIK